MNKLLSILLLSISFTATLLVPEEYSTIQLGVDASSNGDTILVSSGTYYENIHITTENISLIGENKETTIIDGGLNGHVIKLENPAHQTEISNFTIRNGYSSHAGGGIETNGPEDVLFKNLIIHDNFASNYGGGIRFESSSGIIDSCEIFNNEAVRGSAILLSCGSETVEIKNSIIRNNGACEYGVIFSGCNLLKVSNSIISHNEAIGLGASGSDLEVIKTLISDNANDGILFWTNSVGSLSILNSTIVNNGYGIGFAIGGNPTGNASIKNTIIYNNSNLDINGNTIYYPFDIFLSYSIAQNNAFSENAEFYQENNIDGPPLLNDDYTLQSVSPCIDSGDPNSELDPDGTRADMGAYYYHQEPDVLGCTNPNADNYNPNATEDDGSCCIELWGECYNIETTTDLNLGNSGLNGEIPVQIGNLTNLNSLNLSSNQLTGEIPSVIWDMTNLTGLYLSSNQLTGQIPIEIGNLTNLEYLYLWQNQLSGEIPSEIGNLTNLEYLYLLQNQLSGEIPSEIGNLTDLTRIDLRSNQLTGEIPSEIGNLTNLNSLLLSDNQLTGEIPSEIGNLTNLTDLDLGNNEFIGEIPVEIGSLTNLIYLYLSDSQLTGEIPSEIGNLTNLTILELYSNQLTGEIPEEICNQGDITPSLYNNQLCPPYPDCLSEEDLGYQDTSECEVMLGDLNADYHIDILDILILINLIFDDIYNQLGDMNGDGVLDILDCFLLVSYIIDN